MDVGRIRVSVDVGGTGVGAGGTGVGVDVGGLGETLHPANSETTRVKPSIFCNDLTLLIAILLLPSKVVTPS